MRYEVEERGAGIEIHVSDAAGEVPRLLQSFEDCTSGRCACPTDQYDKLGAMHVDATSDEVAVRLEPLPGEHFDPDAIAACLEYTAGHSEE